jgi:hypothetical protein
MTRSHTFSDIRSWTASASRRWFARCDLDGRRRFVADYFEGYLANHHGWLWICSSCLVDGISDRLHPTSTLVTIDRAYVTKSCGCVYDDDGQLMIACAGHFPDDAWDNLSSPCTEHGMENCPCEEGAQYPPHDVASERLGECGACRDEGFVP